MRTIIEIYRQPRALSRYGSVPGLHRPHDRRPELAGSALRDRQCPERGYFAPNSLSQTRAPAVPSSSGQYFATKRS